MPAVLFGHHPCRHQRPSTTDSPDSVLNDPVCAPAHLRAEWTLPVAMSKARARSSRSARTALERVRSQLSDLRDLAADRDRLALRDAALSDWSVAEQIEHLRRSDLTILRAIGDLDPEGPVAGSPTLVGRLVLLTGFIPRGKGKAPGATRPIEVDLAALPDDLDDLRRQFTALDERVDDLAASRATIRHPALGHFTAAQMLVFAAIHHHHHRKIIRDILRARQATSR